MAGLTDIGGIIAKLTTKIPAPSPKGIIYVLVDNSGQIIDKISDGVKDGIIIITNNAQKYFEMIADILTDD